MAELGPRRARQTAPPGTTHLAGPGRGGRSLLQAPQRLPLLPARRPLLSPSGCAEAAAPAAALLPCRQLPLLPLLPRLASPRLTYAAILFRPVVLNVNPT